MHGNTTRNGVIFKVHKLPNGVPISCDLPTYKAALVWVREYWTRHDELLTPVKIVAHPVGARR